MAGTTAQELAELLEDALLLGDDDAVAGLFVEGGVVLTSDGGLAPQGLRACGYVAGTTVVVGDVAVGVGCAAVTVCRRGPDRRWRYIAVVRT